MEAKEGSRLDGIRFRLPTYDYLGAVVAGDREMVIDIGHSDGPYLFVGKKVGHHFEGENTAVGGPRANAKWAEVGNEYVGVWREGTNEYLFIFRF